jgi:hypothetical protein
MRIFSVALFLFGYILMNSGAQDKQLNYSRWLNNDNKEKPDYKPIKKSGMLYSLSNDDNLLIIDLQVPDADLAEKILNTGMVVWIDMDNSKERTLGVAFPVGVENGTKKEKKAAVDPSLLANTIELVGFISEEDRRFSAANNNNFRGYVKTGDQGQLLYRLAMPIEKLPLRNSRAGSGAMPFNLGFEIGYVSKNKSSLKKNEKPEKSSRIYWINDVRLASSR